MADINSMLNPYAGILSPEENQAAMGQGILSLASGLLAGSGWSPHPTTFGSILGQAMPPAMQAQQQFSGQLLNAKMTKLKLDQATQQQAIWSDILRQAGIGQPQNVSPQSVQPPSPVSSTIPPMIAQPPPIPSQGMTQPVSPASGYTNMMPGSSPSALRSIPPIMLGGAFAKGPEGLLDVGKELNKFNDFVIGRDGNIYARDPNNPAALIPAPGAAAAKVTSNYLPSPELDLKDAEYFDKTGRHLPGYTPGVGYGGTSLNKPNINPNVPTPSVSPQSNMSSLEQTISATIPKNISPAQRREILATKMKENPKDLTALEDIQAKADQAIDAAKAVLTSPGLKTATGKLWWLGQIPVGSDAYDSAQKLNTLKGQIMLSVLQSFRSASANGSSGFGQLSNAEGETLRNSVVNLERAQSTPEVKRALQNVIETLNASKDRTNRGYQRLYGMKPDIKTYHTNPSVPENNNIKFLGFE